MRARSLSAAVALTVLGALAATGGSTASAGERTATAHRAGAKSAPAAKAPVVKESRLGHGAGEPTLGITRDGAVYVTASSGCVTSCAGSEESLETVAPGGRAVLATRDGGKSWQDVGPGAAGISPHAVSLDPYLYVDTTGDGQRIFDVDLNLACAELSYTDDGGKQWITNPIACGEPVNDHQTLFTGPPVTSPTIGYPKVVYYCFNHPAVTKCNKSLNGGLTFITTTDVLGPDCGGLNGHGVTDAKGVIYLPLGSCGEPTLAISRDEGASWSMVRTSTLKADNGGDPSVGVDSKGNLYYLFVDTERLPRLTTSKDGGRTWSAPLNVAAPGVKAVNLATLDVGAPGKVAIAYYGTTSEERSAFWNGYLAEGVGVLSGKPLFYSASVNNPRNPLKSKGCGPGRCGRVLDFIDVEIGPDGTPWAAYVDACAALCEKTGEESIHDNEGLVGRLVGGPRLDR
ncbi:MAG: hemagglutinin protein [Frankiales bacterium]|jgi:hypothetical protein|nr:hemagglutinin protein [Frankiales bacterium]